jgi:hypothetical protein
VNLSPLMAGDTSARVAGKAAVVALLVIKTSAGLERATRITEPCSRVEP